MNTRHVTTASRYKTTSMQEAKFGPSPVEAPSARWTFCVCVAATHGHDCVVYMWKKNYIINKVGSQWCTWESGCFSNLKCNLFQFELRTYSIWQLQPLPISKRLDRVHTQIAQNSDPARPPMRPNPNTRLPSWCDICATCSCIIWKIYSVYLRIIYNYI